MRGPIGGRSLSQRRRPAANRDTAARQDARTLDGAPARARRTDRAERGLRDGFRVGAVRRSATGRR